MIQKLVDTKERSEDNGVQKSTQEILGNIDRLQMKFGGK